MTDPVKQLAVLVVLATRPELGLTWRIVTLSGPGRTAVTHDEKHTSSFCSYAA